MPPGRIDQFWAHLKQEGISKNSHWDVMINPPPAIILFSNLAETLSLRCEAGELPGRQLVTNDVKIYGPIYRTAYQSLYAELNLTFIETQDMKVRRFMETWMDAIFDSGSNVLNYQENYVSTITVTQYLMKGRDDQPQTTQAGGLNLDIPYVTPQGPTVIPLAPTNQPVSPVVPRDSGLEPTLYFELYRAYPVNINQMSTSWSDDSPHRVQVTFFYEWYSMFPAIPSQRGRSQGLKEAPTNAPGNSEPVSQVPYFIKRPT
jgi:hypothetical protein